MYVRKFEADSLEEALSSIKRELGPDAIILKTISNKGIKGAFKKKKIEITAAISEKNYSEKIKVDHVLDNDQKEKYYGNSSLYISDSIEKNSKNSKKTSSYGNIAINKNVHTLKEKNKNIEENNFSSDLNTFLNEDLSQKKDYVEENAIKVIDSKKTLDLKDREKKYLEQKKEQDVNNKKLKNKIDDLEKRILQLTSNVEKMENREALALYQLRMTLKSLDIEDTFINKIINKAMFELKREEINNPDIVYEFALREMMVSLNVEMPLFSSVEKRKKSTITILLSDTVCGQSSMAIKMAMLAPDSIIIKRNKSNNNSFSKNMFNLDIINVNTISEIVSEVRKSIANNKTIFIDFKTIVDEVNETKKFVEAIFKAFDNIEVLTCLSAIHSESYNKKVLNKYMDVSSGIILTQLDVCLSFGALFNLHGFTKNMPFKFYGTGEIIPNDIENATAERILSGIFKFND